MSVYVMRAAGTNRFKVGFTSDASPDRRKRALQTGCPHDLVVVAFLPPLEREHERLAHSWLANTRVQGEWFELDEFTERCLVRRLGVLAAAKRVEEVAMYGGPAQVGEAFNDLSSHVWLFDLRGGL